MAVLNDILRKIKQNTLDRTNIDEKIIGGIKNLFGGATKAVNTAGQNLSAWKQVATQPQVRQDYVSGVVMPKLPKLSFSTSKSPTIVNLKSRLNNIKQGLNFNPESNNGNNFWSTSAAQKLANLQKLSQNTGAEEASLKFVEPFKKYGNQALLATQTAASVPLQKIGINYAPSEKLIKRVQNQGMLSDKGNIGGKELWNTARNTANVMLKVKGFLDPTSALRSTLGGMAISPLAQAGSNILSGKPITEDVGKSIISGGITGLGNAGTMSLTNDLVNKFASAIPLLKPLTDENLQKGLPAATDALKPALRKWAVTTGKKLLKAAILETAVETPIWAAINQDDKEKYTDALQREAIENLVMNIGAAGVSSLMDAKTLAPIVKNSVDTAINNYNKWSSSPEGLEAQSGKIDLGAEIGKPKTKIDKDKSIKLYRGLEKKFDPNFDLTKTDAPAGYSTWTDNPELARQYAGKDGYVYEIILPKSQQGKEILNADGDRVLFLNNEKKAGLNNIRGNEYLIYNDHDLYNPSFVRPFQQPEASLVKLTKLPTKDITTTVYDALKSGDVEGARAIHTEFSKEYKMPDFEKMVSKTTNTLKAANPLDNSNQMEGVGSIKSNKPTSLQQKPTDKQLSKMQSELSLEKGNPQSSQLSSLDQTKLKTRETLSKVESQPYFNTEKLNVSKKAKASVDQVIEEAKPAIEKLIGKKLSNKEVIETANLTAKTLNKAVSRDQTKEWEAALLNARNKLAASAKKGTVDKEYLENLSTVKSLGTDIARKLQSFSIGADPKEITSKQAILEAVLKVNDNVDHVLKAAKGVDFNDINQATKFYRQFVKPTTSEWVDLLRYNSMLSSPNTHINNFSSNLQGASIVTPVTKTIAGVVDAVKSALTGSEREYLAGEGPAYLKGYVSSISRAKQAFADVMSGKNLNENPDIRSLPLSTGGKGKALESVLSYPMKLLEASDQFFTALAEGGVESSNKYKTSKGIKPKSEASDEAAYILFRGDLGENQGSKVLNALDTFANLLQKAKSSDNSIVSTIAKYTFPFVRTPTNVLKQGLEYSPLGLSTLPGAKNKSEQIAKVIFGSSIAAGSAILLGSDRITWAEPTDAKKKAQFRAAGMQPYSIKFGNNWVSYSKLHPAIAFNLALVSALKNSQDNRKLNDGEVDTVLKGLSKWWQFFADQSFVKNIGDFVSTTQGDAEGIARYISNYPQQLIPFRALMGWVERLTDPYQRKVDPSGSILEKQLQQIATQIPGLAQKIPTRDDNLGNPIINQNRLLNSISPVKITTEDPQNKQIYDRMVEVSKQNSQLNQIKDQVKSTGQTQLVTREKQSALDKAKASIGKNQGVSQTVGNDIVYFDSASGEVKTVKIDTVKSMPSGTEYEKAKKNAKAYALVDDILNIPDIDDSEKEKIITQQLGLDPTDASYYVTAKEGTKIKTAYVKDILSNSGEDTLATLVGMRKTVNDQRILSDGVIDDLVDEGILTKDEGKTLKSIKYNKDKGFYQTVSSSSTTSTAKKILSLYKDISDSKLSLSKKLTQSYSQPSSNKGTLLRDILTRSQTSGNSVADELLANIKKRSKITPLSQ